MRDSTLQVVVRLSQYAVSLVGPLSVIVVGEAVVYMFSHPMYALSVLGYALLRGLTGVLLRQPQVDGHALGHDSIAHGLAEANRRLLELGESPALGLAYRR